MTGRLKTAFLSASAAAIIAGTALLSSEAARAADMSDLWSGEPGVIESAPAASSPVELGAGWYLRGDVGYVDYANPKGNAGPARLTGEKLEETWSFGGGIGYKFTNWLRSDVTVDYRLPSTLRGTLSTGGGTSYQSGRVDSTTALLNAYADLGTWYGLTPYIGAGIGASTGRIERYTTSDYDIFGNQFDNRSYLPRSQARLAWALMAGTAIDVGGGFQIDLGYRYLNLGALETKPDDFGIPIRIKNRETHEFRVGLRFMIE